MRLSLEQTLENEKHQKIKDNLTNLNKFVRQHFRHQSQNVTTVNIKKPQLNQQQQDQSQQFLNEKIMKKKLKAKFLKKNVDNFNLHEELKQLDNENNRGESQEVDVSLECYDEYNKLLNSMSRIKSKKQKSHKNEGNQSSLEGSPIKHIIKKSSEPKKRLKMKIKVPNPQKQQSYIERKYSDQQDF